MHADLGVIRSEVVIVDKSLLEQARVLEQHTWWQGLANGLGLAAAAGVAVAGVAGLALFFVTNHLKNIETAAETFGKQRDVTIRKGPVSKWPDRLFIEDKWTSSKAADGAVVWVSPTLNSPSADIPTPTDMLLRRDEETFVWVRSMPFGDKYVWPYGPVYDRLKDGNNDITLRTVVGRLGLGDFVRTVGADASEVEIVGIGLESSHGGDKSDDIRILSWHRANAMAEAAAATLTTIDPDKVHFRGLGLGRARKAAVKESAEEKRQRSALIIGVAFMRREARVALDPILLSSILGMPANGLDLMGYEYAVAPADRLTDRIAFGVAAKGGEPLEKPTVTAAEVLIRTSQNGHQ